MVDLIVLVPVHCFLLLFKQDILKYRLTHKASNKNCSRRHLNFYFYLSKKIRLDVSSESSAQQRIHLKHQVLFSLKNNEKNIYECRLLQS